MTSTDFMRLCMRIGIEHFKRIDYDTAKCIVDAVESQKSKVVSPHKPPAVVYEFPSDSGSKVAEEHHKDEGHEGLH